MRKWRNRGIGARAHCESLERRRLLSSVVWTGGGNDGNWNDPKNWSGGTVPGTGDDVTINAGASTTINIAHTDTAFVNSLVSNSPILDFGNIGVTTTANLSANLNVAQLVQGGTWNFSGAEMVFNGPGTLSGITVNGNIDAATSSDSITVIYGLTLNGTMSLGNASGSTAGVVYFGSVSAPGGTLGGTGQIVFGGSANNAIQNAGSGADETFVIATGFTIAGGEGTISSFDRVHYPNEAITNNGTIQANSGGLITIPVVDSNSGTISANGGAISINTVLVTNQGTVQAINGGTLSITDLNNASNGTVSANGSTLNLAGEYINNAGLITVTNSTVNLTGTYDQADLGNFVRSGGTVNATGTLQGDLHLDASTGSWNIGGVLNNGTITTSDGVSANIDGAGTSNGAILNDITIDGDLNLTLGSATLTVEHSLTVTGTLTLGNATGTTDAVIFLGTGAEQLGKTEPGLILGAVGLTAGNIVFGASTGNVIVDNTFMVIPKPGPNDNPAVTSYSDGNSTTYYGGGPVSINAAISGIRGSVVAEYNYSVITMAGSVTASGAATSLYFGGSGVVGVNDVTLNNAATMDANNGGTLVLSGVVNNSVVTAENATLELTGPTLSNPGTITATNSSVNLNGTFFQSELGSFNRPGSIVYLTGTLKGGLNLNANTGSWLLWGGIVDGGTITESGGAELTFTNYGGKFENGVTFDGDMDLDGGIANPGGFEAELIVYSGLTLNGTMYLGNVGNTAYGSVSLGDFYDLPGAITGNGTIVFGSSTNSGATIYNNGSGPNTESLVFGPGITIRGKDGTISSVNSPIVIDGTVNDDTAGGNIQLTAPSVFNYGTIEATNGGTVTITNLTNEPGKTTSANSSTLSLSGTLSNLGTISATNSTVNLGTSFTQANLGTFLRSGGTVNLTGVLTGGLALNDATGSWVLLGGTIQNSAVNMTGAAELVFSYLGGTLRNVVVNGNINDAVSNEGSVSIYGGLVLNGTMTLGFSAGLYFYNTAQTGVSLTGNATILMQGTSVTYNYANASQIFTIGPNVTVEGYGGEFINMASGVTLFQGTINADVPGGAIQLGNGGGSFVDQGAFIATNGTLAFGSPLNVNGQGTLNGNWAGGISIIYGGSIAGNTTAIASSNFKGSVSLAGNTSPELLEVMSQDEGATAAGFKNNFAYGTITIATPDVKLVDNSDNAPGSAPEALYVNSIVVNSFETLDLNGLHIYARAVQIGGATSIINGTITQIPDGGPLDLDSPLPGQISPTSNIDNWTFFGRAGQVITVYVNPGGGSVPSPVSPNVGWVSAQLTGPANQVLASATSPTGGGAISLANVTLPADGIYTVAIGPGTSRPNSTGYYVVGAFDVTPRVAPLLLSQNTIGSINTPFDVQQWTFTALANEQVKLHINNQTSPDLFYTLTGPDGFTGFTNIAGDSNLITLPSDGTYTLTVTGSNGTTGNYSFILNTTTQNSVPLNGSVNSTLAGPGQAELFSINVPSVQALLVQLNDSTPGDSNELYLSFGTPPTPQSYDYRYSLADSASQSVLVPSAAIGTWYALVYSDYVPASSPISVSATGYAVRVSAVTPTSLGNSAPSTIEITGAGFQPGTTVTLISGGGTHYSASTTSVVSYTELLATFPAGLPVGTYSVQATSGPASNILSGAFAVTLGGSAHLETSLQVPSQLGFHTPATLYVTYANDGTVAMPAPLLELGSTDLNQIPLFTLDSSKITGNLRTTVIPDGYSTTLQFLASGAIPGVLEPGESVTIPIYYGGLLQPWDLGDPSVPLNLGVIYTTDTESVDWSSQKSDLQPGDVSNAAWNQIYSNLTAQLGNTWGQYVTALDNNAAYLGSQGENVNDINTLWNFMYMQADDALGPVDHLSSITDASLSLPNGETLSFWRNYHLAIDGRDAFGILGYGWSTPFQSSLNFDSDGNIDLVTEGESTTTYEQNSLGGYFPDADGNTLTATGSGYTILSPDGESNDYDSTGKLISYTDAEGDVIAYSYNGSGQLITMSGDGESITLSYNNAGLVSGMTDSLGDNTTFTYDSQNQYLQSVTDNLGTTYYTYDPSTHSLLGVQNPDGTYTNLGYDAEDRLTSIGSATSAITLAYPQAGEISSTDSLGDTVSTFYNEQGLLSKQIDALGNPTYYAYDDDGNLIRMTDATGDSFTYTYDSSGDLTNITDPRGSSTDYGYGANGNLASTTDADGNITRYAYSSAGVLSSIVYPDGTEESFTFNASDQPTAITQRNGQAISYAYDASGNISQETFADGSHYNYTYNAHGQLLTATDSGGATTFTYNSLGELASIVYPNNTSLTYSYNSAGQTTRIVDQTGYTLNYQYDSAGRAWKVLDGSGNVITTYTYDSMSRVIRQDNANGTYTTVSYDADGDVLHLINYAPGGAVNSRFDYSYNQLDQLISMATLDGTWTYSYDAGSQLTRAIFTSINPNIPSQDIAYSYDALGNRTSTVINGITTAYTANDDNEYTNVGGAQQIYDANGNLIFDGTNTYTYNALNQLTGYSNAQETVQYVYNALGQRIASITNGVTTQYLNNPNGFGSVASEYDNSGNLLAHFNYGMGLVSQTTAAGANYFYDGDALGSVVGVSDSSGSYVDQYSYLPFGGELAASVSVSNPFQFLGLDAVQTQLNGVVSMGAREYSATTGDFNSTDPLQSLGNGENFYSYALNDPTELVDPLGLKIIARYGPPARPASAPGFEPPAAGYVEANFDVMAEAAQDEVSNYVEGAVISIVGDAIGDPEPYSLSRLADQLEQRFDPSNINTWENYSFGKLNMGPFLIGTIEQTLCDPKFAINFVDGINGIRRSGLCGTINAGEAAALIEIGMAPPGCDNAPGLVRPRVPVRAGVSGGSAIASSFDPNDKIGPSGFGSANFVPDTGPFAYHIDFENDPSATAPAQQVTVTDQLDSNLDWSTFRIASIAWGSTVITAPANEQQFQTTVSMTYDGVTFDVLVQVGINLGTGLITANFLSIDPATQLPPSVLIGFLPPEDGTGRGMGYINYTVQPKSNLPTGTQIRNVADVSFDEEQVVATDQVNDDDPTQGVSTSKQALVTIDAVAPTSSVTALPATESSTSFLVSWSGQDDTDGSGIASYTIYVSDNGGAYTPWLTSTTQTSQTYAGTVGHTYAFYSIATDNAGNVQAIPAAAQTQTSVHTGVDILSAVVSLSPSPQIIVQFANPAQVSASDAYVNTSGGRITASSVTYNSSTNTATYSFNFSPTNFVYAAQITLAGQTDSSGNPTQTSLNFIVVQSSSTYALTGSGQTYTVAQLFMGTNSRLDISSNTLLVQYASGNSPLSSIAALIDSASAIGQWNGPGIYSSSIPTNGGIAPTGVGYFDNGTQIKIARAWYGDANLDGQINSDDLSLMLLGQTQHGTRWQDGNFNYDVLVNADDWIEFAYALAYSKGQPLQSSASNVVIANPQTSALTAAGPALSFAQIPASLDNDLIDLLQSPQSIF